MLPHLFAVHFPFFYIMAHVSARLAEFVAPIQNRVAVKSFATVSA